MADYSVLLSQDDFLFHFNNLLLAEGRNATYLFYEVENSPGLTGLFKNDLDHAEIKLKSFMESLPPGRHTITCYISWSPCADCSNQLVEFLRREKNITLRIFVSRIYYYYDIENQEGLQSLRDAGMEIKVMHEEEFEHCWKTFVDHQQREFPGWDDLDDNS
ncbi:DNA dC-_dU-editing enzyme APOBEC-3Ca-like [Dunckerocampus dactyliophorus]|uniref:DNA dC->dU-editing enzyme APOBEC-3Ca-like n=1 Tax=Dunckerocampus dactyliophorus TaxID=161453 RepID=UPI0024058FC9|nr:DNA dC->dU-editing enzyme APOBEC-3Ca-like [Dunckerocampus dactyliophorus]